MHQGVGVLVLRHAEKNKEGQLDREQRGLGLRILEMMKKKIRNAKNHGNISMCL